MLKEVCCWSVEVGGAIAGGAMATCFFHGKPNMTWKWVDIVAWRAAFAGISSTLAFKANECNMKRSREIIVRSSDRSLVACQNAGISLSFCVIVWIAARYFPKFLGAPTEAVAGFLGSSVGTLAGSYMTRNWHDDRSPKPKPLYPPYDKPLFKAW